MAWIRALSIVCGASLAAFAREPAAARSASWPEWRGPEATGEAPGGSPPVRWDARTNVKWRAEVPGKGHSTPIVWGNRVFVLTAVEVEPREEGGSADGVSETVQEEPPRERRRGRGRFGRSRPPDRPHAFTVLCLDRRNGAVVWEKTPAEEIPHEGIHGTGSFASASPVTDGKYLYVSFGSRGVYCYDLEGNLKWKRDLGRMRVKNSFGEGSSPALRGDTLVLNWDHEGESFIVALDSGTGETRWKESRDEETSWSSPLVVKYQDRIQVVTNATRRVRSYDLATGELIWECGGQVSNVIPTPVSDGERVFCMSGYRGSAGYAIPLGSRGDVTDGGKVAWKIERDTPYVPSPLLFGDLLYFTKSRDAILTCVKARTGEPVIEAERIRGLGTVYASPVAAAGRIYIVDLDGRCAVLAKGPKLEVLATNELGERVYGSPAIAGKSLLLRGEKHLYCLESS